MTDITHWYTPGDDGAWIQAPDPRDCSQCVDVTGQIPGSAVQQASIGPAVQANIPTPHAMPHMPKAVEGAIPRTPGLPGEDSTPVARPRATRRPGSS